jgi:hypothetical protein
MLCQVLLQVLKCVCKSHVKLDFKFIAKRKQGNKNAVVIGNRLGTCQQIEITKAIL